MSEFKLGDEEKGFESHSRNSPSDFYSQLNDASTYNSMHTTVDAPDPMIAGQ